MANMPDAIIIVTGGIFQIPAVENAKKLKLKTIVTDGNKNAICSNLADNLSEKGKISKELKKANKALAKATAKNNAIAESIKWSKNISPFIFWYTWTIVIHSYN